MRVIYVEDDPASAAVMQQMMATAGVAVTGASSAREGLALFERNCFDVVMMDIRMPEVSGLTAIRQLRSRERPGQYVPVIVVSAELTAGVRELCRGAGADAFVEKPIAMEQLFRVLGETLAGSENVSLS